MAQSPPTASMASLTAVAAAVAVFGSQSAGFPAKAAFQPMVAQVSFHLAGAVVVGALPFITPATRLPGRFQPKAERALVMAALALFSLMAARIRPTET